MPSSWPTFDAEIELYFREARPETALDIGAGEGKYAKLIRRASEETRLTGIEIDEEYVERFKLRELYDELIVGDAMELPGRPQAQFDAVVIGDCIEHMRKSAGADLLHFLVYRSKVIFVKFPVQLVQHDHGGHAGEAHLSVWSQDDFRCFDHIYVKRELMHLAVVRGYENHAIEWLPNAVVKRLGYESCRASYDAKPGRWDLADSWTRWEERVRIEVGLILAPGESFILADLAQTNAMQRLGANGKPFMERDGKYWGMPADDKAAIEEIERQRSAGARCMVFLAPAIWALLHYARMNAYLRKKYRCAMENEVMAVFDLHTIGKRAARNNECRNSNDE